MWIEGGESTGAWSMSGPTSGWGCAGDPDLFDLPVETSRQQSVSHPWTTNPVTGQPWTAAEVNGLEAGFREYELNGIVDSETRVTQLMVTVTSTLDAYDDGPNGLDELLSINGDSTMFTHTPNGETATRTAGGVTWTYAYNGMGLLEEVREGSNVRATYAHDALGRRVKATEDGVTTYVAYGLGLDPLWEKTGTTETRHVYANGMRVARIPSSGTVHYYLADHLGSTRKVLDAARNPVFSTDYEPFGKPVAPSGTESYTYTMEKHDDPTGTSSTCGPASTTPRSGGS